MFKDVAISIIQICKNIFGLQSGCCKYNPTCSHYAVEVIKKKGIIKGIPKIIIRLVKCNPFSKGGFDPV